MNFGFSEEQEELRRAVRRFLEDKSPSSEVRRLMETTDGYDAAVWSQMANQLGLQSLTIPEEHGGAGFGYVELVVVLEEMGRALLCAPYFSTVALAANALLASGDAAAQGDYLPAIASGETIATLAFTEESGRWDLDGITLAASQSGGRLDALRRQVLRPRRPHRLARARGGPDRRRGEPLRRRGRRRGLRGDPARHDGPDPQAGPARVLRACRPG